MDEVPAYVKLTQTPLAKSAVCCICPAKIWTIFLGILSLALSVIPGFVFAGLAVNDYKYEIKDPMREDPSKNLKYACVAMFIIFGVLHFAGNVILIMGGFKQDPRYLCPWATTQIFSFIFARLVSGAILLSIGFKEWPVAVIICACFDFIIGILVGVCSIYLAGEYRTNKYVKRAAQPVGYNKSVDNEVRVNLLPANAYPRQV